MVSRTSNSVNIGVQATENLPLALLREIGRVIVAFSKLDYIFTQTICVILQIDRQTGRIVLKETNLIDRIGMIQDLLEERSVKVSTDFAALRKEVEKSQANRNYLAHGVWVKDIRSGVFCVSTGNRGNWRPKGANGKVKRAVMPQGVIMDTDTCRELVAAIHKAARILDALINEILSVRPLPTSLQTPAGRSHPAGQVGAHSLVERISKPSTS